MKNYETTLKNHESQLKTMKQPWKTMETNVTSLTPASTDLHD